MGLSGESTVLKEDVSSAGWGVGECRCGGYKAAPLTHVAVSSKYDLLLEKENKVEVWGKGKEDKRELDGSILWWLHLGNRVGEGG